MTSKAEIALLLAMEVMLTPNASIKERKEKRDEALKRINRVLEDSGYRMPENDSGW